MLGIVLMLVIPLPPPVLDVLLAFDILGSGVVLLTSVAVREPLEFAAFAPTLLVATLFRLALDVSAARLILTQGNVPGAVGELVPAFGALVLRGNLVVGIIIFIILVTIQFVVIAAGSQRVAEVAARFTLDAMPGKQMAIDAEVHAGSLDAESARRKRAHVQKEADFYGAMEGAGKFVKGDAIAALAIAALNLLGGMIVGVAYHGMSPLDALNTFAILAIGNAVVTTLPAFLLSTAMGLMVTRTAAEGSLGADLAAQLLARPEVLRIAAGFALILAMVPAFPHLIFGFSSMGLFLASNAARRRRSRADEQERSRISEVRRGAIRRPEMALGLIGVDALAIDIGADLAALLASPACDALLDRIGEVRRALASEIGLVTPGVRLRDDLSRDPATYAIRVRDIVVAEGRLRLDALLAVADDPILATFPGDPVREPVYGLPARWIAQDLRERATSSGALVFDPISIIGSHLAESVRSHAAELLGRQELHTLCEHLRASVPSLVKEIGSDGVPLATVQRVFERLFQERAWPRDTIAVFETLVDAAPIERELRELVERVRRRLVPAQLRARGMTRLEPLILSPDFERRLIDAWTLENGSLDARDAASVRSAVATYLEKVPRGSAALVCGAALRSVLWEFLDRSRLRIDVFAYGELPPELQIVPAQVVDGSALALA
jgi:flagellar biosynthesis protein FlhA